MTRKYLQTLNLLMTNFISSSHKHPSKHANTHSAVHELLLPRVLCWVLCCRWSDWIRERIWWNRWIKWRRSKSCSFLYFTILHTITFAYGWLTCFRSQATSRLLVNYEEPYRSHILDFLFKVLGHMSLRYVSFNYGHALNNRMCSNAGLVLFSPTLELHCTCWK